MSCSVKGSRCGPHKCLTMAGDGERRLPTFVPVAFESECQYDSQTSDVHRAAGNLCMKLSGANDLAVQVKTLPTIFAAKS